MNIDYESKIEKLKVYKKVFKHISAGVCTSCNKQVMIE